MNFKKNSIMQKILIPVMLIVVILVMLYTGIIFFSGSLKQIRDNCCQNLSEKVATKTSYLQDEMLRRWSNIYSHVNYINDKVDRFLLKEGYGYEDLHTNSALNRRIIYEITEDIIYMIRTSSVTGGFVVLDGPAGEDLNMNAGMYLRNIDPTIKSTDNSDLLCERGYQNQNISLNSYWIPGFSFKGDNSQQEEFYFMPFNAAKNARYISSAKDKGYWSKPFRLSQGDYEIITFSCPLISPSGYVYGVIGIDLTLRYLTSYLDYTELGDKNKTGYVLCTVDDQTNKIFKIVSNGSGYNKFFGTENSVVYKDSNLYHDFYEFENTKDQYENVHGSMRMLSLYMEDSPYENSSWALIGLVEDDLLFAPYNRLNFLIIVCIAVSLAVGVVGATILTRVITRPIAKLVDNIKNSNPAAEQELKSVNTYEIDVLAHAVNNLRREVAAASSKTETIIKMMALQLGVFEYNNEKNMIYCNDVLFTMLGWEKYKEERETLSPQRFSELMTKFNEEHKTNKPFIYKIAESNRYLQLILKEVGATTIGVLTDITKDIAEKSKLEYERDYDILTNLFNRRSISAELSRAFDDKSTLKNACLIMCDLDNLKFINDNYGHDYGDQYIQAMAKWLQIFTNYGGIVARLSGDEFLIFLKGYDDAEQLRKLVKTLWKTIEHEYFPLPTEPNNKLHASAGVARYPQDTDNLELLKKYADFAMYTVKHSEKGKLGEFDKKAYGENSILLDGQGEFEKFLDKKLVRYAFQPIVSAKNGEMFAFEALMRPQTSSFSSPFDILRIAKTQSKLNQIESLTMFESLQEFQQLCVNNIIGKQVKLFVNSISSCIMSPDDIKIFQNKYREYLNRIVLEITESEPINIEYTNAKAELLASWGGALALDDLGSGYNSESLLLMFNPSYFKIDMSIVRNVDKDSNRINIVNNFIQFARHQNMQVIAEGVETEAELKVLIELGVDLVQGYLIGKPEFTVNEIDSNIRKLINKFYSDSKGK